MHAGACALAADVRACVGQGHALFTRQAGSSDPCPLVDFDGGWNSFFAGAYGLPAGVTVAQRFGAPFDYSFSDATFTICVLALDEIGATSNKVPRPAPSVRCAIAAHCLMASLHLSFLREPECFWPCLTPIANSCFTIWWSWKVLLFFLFLLDYRRPTGMWHGEVFNPVTAMQLALALTLCNRAAGSHQPVHQPCPGQRCCRPGDERNCAVYCGGEP